MRQNEQAMRTRLVDADLVVRHTEGFAIELSR